MKNIPSPQLITELKELVRIETQTTAQIIEYLEEVERRRLHLPKYTSMFDFLIKELGYTPNEAQPRLAAMRVLREQPELKAKLVSGEIPLTNFAQAASYFKQGSYTPQEKKAIVLSLEELSTREVKNKLYPGAQELKFLAHEELQVDLRDLRDLFPNEPGLAGLIQKIAKIVLKNVRTRRTRPAAERPDVRRPSPDLVRRVRERDQKCT